MISGASSLVVDMKRQSVSSPGRYGEIPGMEEQNAIKSLEDIQKVLESSHRYSGKTYLSVDREIHFHPDMSTVIMLMQTMCSLTDIDGVVTCNPALITALKEEEITTDIILGPEELVLNTETVRFWADLGVTKIILPSYLTIDEIEVIVGNAGRMDLSVSVLHGHMSAFAGPEHGTQENDQLNGLTHSKLDGVFCALCNIPRLNRAGIAAVTVRLGGDTCNMNVGLVTLARKLMDMCLEGAPEEEVARTVREEIHCSNLCERGYLCLATRPSTHRFTS
jgi:collagenase-like PrtC family protease